MLVSLLPLCKVLISSQSSLTKFAENLQEMINYHTVRKSGQKAFAVLHYCLWLLLFFFLCHFWNAKLKCAEMRILKSGEMTAIIWHAPVSLYSLQLLQLHCCCQLWAVCNKVLNECFKEFTLIFKLILHHFHLKLTGLW